MPTFAELLAAKGQSLEQPTQPVDRSFGERLADFGMRIGGIDPNQVRQQRLKNATLEREAELGKLDERIKVAQLQKEAELDDPKSAASVDAQDKAAKMMVSSGKLFNKPVSLDEAKTYVAGRSLNQLKDYKVVDLVKDAAQIAAMREKATAGSGKETRRTNNEIRSRMFQVVQQDLPEMRELRKNIRSADSLLEQTGLALDNPIARGSLGFLAARVAGSNSQLSDKERETFTRAGGVPQKAAQALKDIQNGTLTPEMAGNYRAWLTVLNGRAKMQLDDIKQMQVKKFESLYDPESIKGFDYKQFFDALENDEPSQQQQPVNVKVINGISYQKQADGKWYPVK